MITELKRMECEVVLDSQVNFSDIPPFRMPNVALAIETKLMVKVYERIRTIRILLNRTINRDANDRLQKLRKNNRNKNEI